MATFDKLSKESKTEQIERYEKFEEKQRGLSSDEIQEDYKRAAKRYRQKKKYPSKNTKDSTKD